MVVPSFRGRGTVPFSGLEPVPAALLWVWVVLLVLEVASPAIVLPRWAWISFDHSCWVGSQDLSVKISSLGRASFLGSHELSSQKSAPWLPRGGDFPRRGSL